MSARLNPYAAAPEMISATTALETAVVSSGLEHSLIELVKTRASQINGCAFCIHMHTRDARAHGRADKEACEQHDERAGRADSGKGVRAEVFAHNERVRRAV